MHKADKVEIKNKSITGFTWSFVETFANQGILFIVGVILARMLTPADFGLIGLTAIFTGIADSFVNSGFSQALIRKTDTDEKDYSTVFYFNFFVGALLYLLIFFSSGIISTFFKTPELKRVIQVISLIIVIDALALVPRTILTKKIDFKSQAKISIVSSVISGIVAIIMAYMGFGVWSLVIKTIVQKSITVVLLYSFQFWKPVFVFNKQSFHNLFHFGSKLLIGGLFDTVYHYIYYFIIGRYFSPAHLGLYSKADQFQKLPTSNINAIFSKVAFPVLSEIQNNEEDLKIHFIKLLKHIMFVSFFSMFLFIVIAKPLIILLLGNKWAGSIIYLQLLCLIGVQLPINSLNLLLLHIKGRSDLYLKIELIKKITALPVLLLGIFYSIESMIISIAILSLIYYFLNSKWTIHYIKYSSLQQLYDISKSFSISLLCAGLAFCLTFFIKNLLLLLFLQVGVSLIALAVLAETFQLQEYKTFKNIIFSKIKKFRLRQLR
jgi:teichuronic acid exporter